MTDELNNNFETDDNEQLEPPIEETRPLPYAQDPFYKDLLKHYQNADWDAVMEVLDSLLKSYPEDPGLVEFQNEVRMRVDMQRVGQEYDKIEKKQQFVQLGIRALIGLAVIAILVFAVRGGINIYNNRVNQARLEREQNELAKSLAIKFENAEAYMLGGRVAEALAIYEEIQEKDPGYDQVEEKIEIAQSMLALDELYQQGRSAYLAGDLDAAKDILEDVLKVDGLYKDASLILTSIDNTIAIEDLFGQAEEAYQNNDWLGVVNAADEIRSIDNTTDLSVLEVPLFTSYMNLVIETAEGGDASVAEVEQAEKYYRSALAIFPQNKEFSKEREELQRVAINLLANKYYIGALELIDVEEYSIPAMEEALRLLTKASNIGSGSPAIAVEITNLTIFLTAFDNFISRRWEAAIDGFEQLYRDNPDYAEGLLKYLIYETYLARGDTFYSFAEYSNARNDYNAAETFARVGDQGNLLRLFQIEIRIGYTLRKLSLPAEAAEYFSYALGLVNFADKVPADKQDVLNIYYEAEAALAANDFWNAARLYEILLEDTEFLYEFETISIAKREPLAQMAYKFGSSIDTILLYNPSLGDSLAARTDQEIRIPILVED